jgi:hypothetical protein
MRSEAKCWTEKGPSGRSHSKSGTFAAHPKELRVVSVSNCIWIQAFKRHMPSQRIAETNARIESSVINVLALSWLLASDLCTLKRASLSTSA